MKNWSLSTKIWSVFGLLCASFVVSTANNVSEMNSTSTTVNEITEVFFKRYRLTNEFKDAQRQTILAIFEMIARTDKEGIESAGEAFEKSSKLCREKVEEYKAAASTQGKELATKYGTSFDKFVELANEAKRHVEQGRDAEAESIIVGAKGLRQEMLHTIDEINTVTLGRVDTAADEVKADMKHAMIVSILVSTMSIFASLIIAFFVLRSLMGSISTIVRTLSDSSIQVSGAATQIASSSEELSQAATEQAASLEETAASVEEMNSMIAKNSENAKSTEETSGKSQEAVNQGKDIIKKMMESMEAINLSSEGMAETVKVIEQIDKKTKVINEIVNKTELLSFNASVEAARAGEHGKGFAVVAEEVGNLARMSGAAAEEIGTLLADSIEKVNQMVATTKRNVETGTQVTRECSEVFDDVVRHVSSVSGMASEISSASQEQSRGISEITKAMSQLDQMTQQNAATSQECAASAEELSAQAESLKSAVSHLVMTVSGQNAQSIGYGSETAVQQQRAPRPATKASGANKVVQLRGPRDNSRPVASGLKRAAGDAPSYNSDGFNDI